MKERKLICIVCPKGCELTVSFDGAEKIERIEGHTCKKGEQYAETECTHPMRTVTTTVKTADGIPVSVKTENAIPKECIFDVMKQINRAVAPDKVAIGDVICTVNAGDKSVNIVATSEK